MKKKGTLLEEKYVSSRKEYCPSVCIHVTIQTSVYTAMSLQVALNAVTSLQGQEREGCH